VAGIPICWPHFVLPNDPAVACVLLKASELMRAQDRRSLEGYQRADKQRVWQQAAAVWSRSAILISTTSIHRHVLSRPASACACRRKLSRAAGNLPGHRHVSCACLEQIGLRPLLVINTRPRHAGSG